MQIVRLSRTVGRWRIMSAGTQQIILANLIIDRLVQDQTPCTVDRTEPNDREDGKHDNSFTMLVRGPCTSRPGRFLIRGVGSILPELAAPILTWLCQMFRRDNFRLLAIGEQLQREIS